MKCAQYKFCLLLFVLFHSLEISAQKEKVFFAFDDHSVPWQHNLKLTMVPAQKHPGNPVLRQGSPGAPDHRGVLMYGTVMKTGNKYRMWYLGRLETTYSDGRPPLNWTPLCYAESDDGINWQKPALNLVEHNGNKRNNMCLIEGAPASLTVVNDFVSVIYDPEDKDPQRRYKATYISYPPVKDIKGGLSNVGLREDSTVAMMCITSADGLRWKLASDRPANAGGERFEVTGLYRFGNFYYATGQLLHPWAWLPDGRNGGQVMLAYRSADFINWSKVKAFAFARPGQLTNPATPYEDTHMGAGLWNRGNILVGVYGLWNDTVESKSPGEGYNPGLTIDLGLIVSNDGIHYREPVPGYKIVARGGKDDWDNVGLLQGHALVNDGDTTKIWYSHADITFGKKVAMAVGMATLRRDGFGYLSRKEDDNDATLVTTSFQTSAKQNLILNVDGLDAGAPLVIELLDEYDRPVKNYSGENAAKITSNGTQVEIKWPRATALPANTKIAVKIYFTENSQAKVYALYIK